MNHPAKLICSTGMEMSGTLIGKLASSSGEVVFTTSPVGYVETLTDPSYFGQIIVFAYPLIGNYGVPRGDLKVPHGRWEGRKIFARGVVITKDFERAFHWEAVKSLHHWLEEEGVPCLSGADTRALVQHIRDHNKVLGKIIPDKTDPAQIDFFDPGTINTLPHVSCKKPLTIGEGRCKLALIDFGSKWNIARKLIERGFQLEVLPWDFAFKQAKVDGFVLSNGPGDPALTGDLATRVRELYQLKKPILGICLGHQIMALAAGAKTHRLSFGHRGANHPVQLVGTQRGFLTSQNHGYVVDDKTLPSDWAPWFINANDGTCEGIKHRQHPYMSVQFHPEAACGPKDTEWIFDEYAKFFFATKTLGAEEPVCHSTPH